MTPKRFKHMGNVSEIYEWKCSGCAVLTTSYIFNCGSFQNGDRFRCANCGKINYFNLEKRGYMFFNERCVELKDMADNFQNCGKTMNAQFLLDTVLYMNLMNNRIISLQDAIQSVLDDSESKDGGWGPDVTALEKLRSVMPKIVTPNR